MKYLNRKFQQGGAAPQNGGQDMAQQIAEAMMKGAKDEQIIQVLVKQGKSQEEATQITQSIRQQLKAKHEQGGKLNLLASLKKGGFLNKKKGEPMVKEETPAEKPVDKKAAFMQMLADKKKGKVEKAQEGTYLENPRLWTPTKAEIEDKKNQMWLKKNRPSTAEEIAKAKAEKTKAIKVNTEIVPITKKKLGGPVPNSSSKELIPKKEDNKKRGELISNKCGGKAKKAESGTTLPGFNIPKVDKDSGANTTKKKPTEEKIKKNAKGDKLDKKEAYSKNSIKGLEPKDVFKKGAKMKKCANGCGCNKPPKLSMHKNGGRLQEVCSCCGEVCN